MGYLRKSPQIKGSQGGFTKWHWFWWIHIESSPLPGKVRRVISAMSWVRWVPERLNCLNSSPRRPGEKTRVWLHSQWDTLTVVERQHTCTHFPSTFSSSKQVLWVTGWSQVLGECKTRTRHWLPLAWCVHPHRTRPVFWFFLTRCICPDFWVGSEFTSVTPLDTFPLKRYWHIHSSGSYVRKRSF